MKLGIESELTKALKNIKYEQDELAYLALTSKIEHTLRDKWAYGLHDNLNKKSKDNIIVSREWHRTDLALLDAKTKKAKALIEIKAIYSFDVAAKYKIGQYIKAEHPFLDLMLYDVKKAKDLKDDHQGLVDEDLEIYKVLFVTHPKMGTGGTKWNNIIKYRGSIDSCLKKINERDLIDEVKTSLNKEFNKESILKKGGKAFDIEVDIYCWIVKAN
ncbi:hypothetical protein AADZ91_12585 [Colwelliaceae bacterium 6441]